MTVGGRRVREVIAPRWVMEGGGVPVRRCFDPAEDGGAGPLRRLDHFGQPAEEGGGRGFPMHAHRGVESVTYMLAGYLDQRDAGGERLRIGPGDLLWITAGRGVEHEEIPSRGPRGTSGIHLLLDLPAERRSSEPSVLTIRSERIPEVLREDGAHVRILAGSSSGVRGAVVARAGEVTFLDVTLAPGTRFLHPLAEEDCALAYLVEGAATFGPTDGGQGTRAAAPGALLLGPGNALAVRASPAGARFLLVAAAARGAAPTGPGTPG